MNPIGSVGRRHIARHGNYRRPAIDHSRQNRGINHRPGLLRIHDAPNVEACGIEKLVRVELFEGSRIDQLCFHVARDCDDRGAFLPRIHQPVKQVCNSRARSAAHYDRSAREIGLGNCREDAIFFMAHMDELDLPVAVKRVDHGIQRISDDSVTAFDAGLLKHFPHYIGNVPRHVTPPALPKAFVPWSHAFDA